MDRRDFLKMLGFGAASAMVPFGIIKGKIPTSTKLEQAKLRVEAIENGNTQYRIIILDDKGNHMWAPPVKEVVRDGDSAIFIAEDVAIDKSCVLVGAKLLTPDGKFVGEQAFAHSIYAGYGDIIKLTYNVDV